ncbi:unnamed protein product, partial [marine sediment metagenome]
MKTRALNKTAKRRDRKAKDSETPGNLKPSAHTEILKACRKLSNILDPEELYAVFADVIKKKFAIRHLAIFLYHKTDDALELVFSEGLGEVNFQVKRNKSSLWKSISSGELFAVSDDAGNQLFSTEFKKRGLEKLQSELWVPLGMGDELVGLVTFGSKGANRAFTCVA